MALELLAELISKVEGVTDEQKENNKVSFRIIYYPFIGRVGPLRASAIIGGISFEDELITFEQQSVTKKAGGRRWSGPPELTIYNNEGNEIFTMGQSNAILRYIGSLCGQYPSTNTNPLKTALIDEVMDSTEDIINMMVPLFIANHVLNNKELKAAEVRKLSQADMLPYWLNKFQDRLLENEKRGNNKGFIVGNELTIADLKLYYQLYRMYDENEYDLGIKQLFDKFPRLVQYIQIMNAIDGIKATNDGFVEIQREHNENGKSIFQHDGVFIPGP